MLRTAVVVGAGGQDGRCLVPQLLASGRRVIGIARHETTDSAGEACSPIDVRESRAVRDLLARIGPSDIFYLAAHHHSSEDAGSRASRELYVASHDVHVLGPLNFLEGFRLESPLSRLFFASSCLVFEKTASLRQTEVTPLEPSGIYGITKAVGMAICRLYREEHGLFAASGILYNHESPFRGERFVTQKIARGVAGIRRAGKGELVLGDLDSRIDWGWAPDFADAMIRILLLESPDDFVVATGSAHSVREFAERAFRRAGIDGTGRVRTEGRALVRRRGTLLGDPSRLKERTGWAPTLPFEAIVDRMVDAAIERAGRD